MIQKSLLTTALAGLLTTFAAHAATQCVALDNSGHYPCTATGASYTGKLEWAVNCNNPSAGTQIVKLKGIAMCTDSYPGTPGNGPSGDMPSSNSGTYCYCKTIYPFISNWSWSSNSLTSGGCANGCANSCVYSLTTYDQASNLTRKTLFTPSNN